jgi:hypothetical protein
VPSARAGGGLLQWAGHGGAVDQRGQERAPMDTAIVPVDAGQRCPSSASCVSVRLGELFSHPRLAE